MGLLTLVLKAWRYDSSGHVADGIVDEPARIHVHDIQVTKLG
jgi:hypothetical protein